MQKGFTLLEILIAISVMIVGIVGIYALVPKIISVTSVNTDRFIASQLAREGMELVRNIRDTNWLEGESWDMGLTICQPANNKFCEAEYDDHSLTSYDAGPDSGSFLQVDSNGFYNYGEGTQTKFKRKIKITPQGNVLKVEIELSWEGKGSPLVIKENLHKWLR